MWKFGLLILCIYCTGANAQVLEGDTLYFLTNRQANMQRLTTNNYGSNIDRNAPVKILIHGWTHDITSFWYGMTTQSFVESGANVIAIDWGRHAQLVLATSIARVPQIGEFVADFIIGLSNSQGIPLSRFHIVGHSLGAHLAGYAAKSITRRTGGLIDRITGLDPAAITFTLAACPDRLCTSDARHVDTILTDAGPSGAGIPRSIGHVNFWPNGGIAVQPGCLYYPCSHNRAAHYFNEGIWSDRFVARRCTTYANYRLGLCNSNPRTVLGINTSFAVTGDFFLSTNTRPPFARG